MFDKLHIGIGDIEEREDHSEEHNHCAHEVSTGFEVLYMSYHIDCQVQGLGEKRI